MQLQFLTGFLKKINIETVQIAEKKVKKYKNIFDKVAMLPYIQHISVLSTDGYAADVASELAFRFLGHQRQVNNFGTHLQLY